MPEASDHLEAVLTWRTVEPSTDAIEWLERHGLQTQPMRSGLLVSGSRRVFELAFHFTMADAASISIPIPDELASHVSSLEIRRFDYTRQR